MHIVLLGDSNTFLGGEQCDKPQGWNKWFKDMAKPLSCCSYARSGATWTHTAKTSYDIVENTGVLSDDNVIYNQINRLKKACEEQAQPIPDIIIIMAGTNDLWFADQRPDSLSKWIQYDVVCLRESFPQSWIVLVTPPPFVKVSEEKQHQAADEIEETARKLSVEVIRLDYTNQLFHASDMIRKGYSKDGVHTTVKGARVLGKYIYKQIMAMVKK